VAVKPEFALAEINAGASEMARRVALQRAAAELSIVHTPDSDTSGGE
jgi:hypothetical protein